MSVEIAAKFLEQKLSQWNQKKPLVLGISGPQGGGKLYLAEKLLQHLAEAHPKLHAVGVLIDDFYLTHDEQQLVSAKARDSGNFVLEGRGLPGTHDVGLALDVMDKLVKREPCQVPVYDKSAYGGAGDRVARDRWQQVDAPSADVVIFEGWFTGFRAIDDACFPSVYLSCDPSGVVARSSMHHLQEINRDLRAYEKLWQFFDYFVYLQVQNLDYIYQWRQQQEDHLKETHGLGMSQTQVTAFVRRYMPMYHLYYWRMCRQGFLPSGHNLQILVDLNRAVVESHEV